MKKIIAILVLLLTVATLVPLTAQNVHVNININLDRQPAWGPVGYSYVDFYYFPDLNIYYDVNYAVFHYVSGGRWVSSRFLPSKYKRYDLYGMYKVVINDPNPWLHNRVHKKNYARYKNNRTQVAIRYSNDVRYQKSRQNTYTWIDETPRKTTNTNSRSAVNNNRKNTKTNNKSSSSVSTGRNTTEKRSNQKNPRTSASSGNSRSSR